MATESAARAEDVGNIIQLEHLNICVSDQLTATWFYVAGLGLTRNPYSAFNPDNMHVNVGQQQFHLPTRGAQVLPGHVGLVIPNHEALRDRLRAVEPKLKGTEFAWSDADGYLAVTCPWGNQLRCYEPGPQFGEMTLGMPYILFETRRGTAAGIARFYEHVMGAAATIESNGPNDVAYVDVGTSQTLIFEENGRDLPPYAGYHIAVYIASFSRPYEYLKERNLITEDIRNSQFRFDQIVDPESGDPIFTLEHEMRSLQHPGFGMQFINRDPVPHRPSWTRTRERRFAVHSS